MSLRAVARMFGFPLCLALAGSAGLSCAAQAAPEPVHGPATAVYDLDRDRDLSVPLDGAWRRQTGDDPAWASPTFDDSGWALVSPLEPWSEQKFSGMAWYRVKVRVPANSGPLALYVSRLDTSFQIFANGQMVTSFGGFPPHPVAYTSPSRVYNLPAANTGQPYTLTLAIRVWHWPVWAEYVRGGPYPGLRVGNVTLMQTMLSVATSGTSWRLAGNIFLAILDCLAGLTALALFAFRRQQREFFWFSLLLLGSAADVSLSNYVSFHASDPNARDLILNVIEVVTTVAEIGLYYRLLGGRRDWLFWAAIASVAGEVLLIVPEYQNRLDATTLNVVIIVLSIPPIVWMFALLFRRALQGFPDARLLVAPVFLSKAAGLVVLVYWIATTANWNIGSDSWVSRTLSWPFDMSFENIGAVLFLVGMLAILIRRFTRTQQHEESYERERLAARTVQQLLIPADLPLTPGYAIAAVYEPASEVSGDFFQVIPLDSGAMAGSVLIAVGDVSGKGLPAALMVSLLVGTLRTYAETLVSPAEILAGLNRRVHGRTGGGFTTCVVLRADADGTVTLANAGHIAPYLDGVEIPVDNGLPLGLTAESVYTEAAFELAGGARLTLLTDGVVEARSQTGELFGFQRTEAISRQSPAAIAQAAQSFGQDDDITVLSLVREAS
jgi:hypothetical protein